jgi:proteasome lid subunit RPN8/RPN11
VRPVTLPPELLGAVRRHALAEYPDECCGFLIADPDPADPSHPRRIVAAERAPNTHTGERRGRYEIRPNELLAAERRREGTGTVVAGFYHSHPDQPARPSQFDEEHAWPWYSYLVVAVTARDVPAVAAFELDPDSRTFREVPLTNLPSRGGQVTESLSAAVSKGALWAASP